MRRITIWRIAGAVGIGGAALLAVVAAVDWGWNFRALQQHTDTYAVSLSKRAIEGGPVRIRSRYPDMSFNVEYPPRTGRYTQSRTAVRVVGRMRWRPLLPFLFGGGEHIIETAATADEMNDGTPETSAMMRLE